jgi:hypothetical protein
MTGLEVEIMLADTRSILDLFQVNHVLLLFRRACGFGLLEPVLPVIHDLHYRWAGLRGNLYQIELSFLRGPQRLFYRNDPNLFAVSANEAHRADPNLVIDPRACVFQ